MPTPASPCYIGGEWKGTSTEDRFVEILNPFDNSLVGKVSLANEVDIDTAVERAQEGFEKTRVLHSHERYDILSAIAAGIREQKEEFALGLVAEVGKPISAARVEIERSITTFQYAAEESRRLGGDVIPLDIASAGQGRFGVIRRFPLGVVLGISPFNFPLNLVAHKVAPAIASGNAFLLKPATQASLTSLRLAKIIESSGYPREAFSVIPCTNSLAERLVQDERIKLFSFTGSPAVGWTLKSKAGKKKVVLELGGNAGVIVDRSADIEVAVKKNLLGSFIYSGQVCIKVQRIYVHHDIFDEYLRRFLDAARQLRVGNPLDPETVAGPVINSESVDRIISWVEEAKELGAKVLLGGGHVGRVIEPTVLIDVSPEAKVFCTEVFGPVVTLHKFHTIEQAVAGVNDSRYGLQAGLFSNDYRNILYAYNHLDVGAVIINENPTFRVDNMPYGGVKDSGFGREGVRYAIEEMTEPKMLALGV
ncbi:MAG: aldehyde dehydrogenase family protein [Ignavibacteriales bacterium]|nr:aldehyde dehydrogenase family protein [Ignavibacteriales bacterium]